jgi:TetR/AcrR family transcriptional repressor of bet genes
MIVHSLQSTGYSLNIVQLMKAALKKRTAPKGERQQQLIQATIRSVASLGLSDTTMASVCREAGLSQGIINLHFQSKERLLVKTLAYIAEEYRDCWETALRKVDGGPAEKLAALVAVDFKQQVCDRNKLAVWFAFWGESKSRPVYRKICAERDIAYRKEMVQVCAELIEQGGYQGIVAETVAACLSTMTSGCWLDMLTNPRSMNRQQGLQICMSFLEITFPRHFSERSAEA